MEFLFRRFGKRRRGRERLREEVGLVSSLGGGAGGVQGRKISRHFLSSLSFFFSPDGEQLLSRESPHGRDVSRGGRHLFAKAESKAQGVADCLRASSGDFRWRGRVFLRFFSFAFFDFTLTAVFYLVSPSLDLIAPPSLPNSPFFSTAIAQASNSEMSKPAPEQVTVKVPEQPPASSSSTAPTMPAPPSTATATGPPPPPPVYPGGPPPGGGPYYPPPPPLQPPPRPLPSPGASAALTCISVLWAILLPPVGVALRGAPCSVVLLNLLLTLLCWFPGVIHALCVIGLIGGAEEAAWQRQQQQQAYQLGAMQASAAGGAPPPPPRPPYHFSGGYQPGMAVPPPPPPAYAYRQQQQQQQQQAPPLPQEQAPPAAAAPTPSPAPTPEAPGTHAIPAAKPGGPGAINYPKV